MISFKYSKKTKETMANKKEEIAAEPKVIQDRYKKLEEIRKLGIEPYPYRFNRTHHAGDIISKYSKLKPEEKTKDKVIVAGRIMSIREMGKISFGHIQDQSARIQFLIKKDDDEKQYQLFRLLDIGDWVGIEGIVFKTRTGEITIETAKLTLLSKSLYPLPDKWHGIKDPEIKYRRRYLDLMMNPESRKVFVMRSRIIDAVREFLVSRGFIEVDTPALQPIYGGAAARPFKTHLNALDMDIYLRISDELYLKRLIVGGYDRVFEFAKDFRNEGIDRTHNPEFLQMECYQAYADYNDMMELTEDLFVYVAKKLFGKTKIEYQGKEIDFKKPWARVTMSDALKEYAKIDISKMSDKELMRIIEQKKIEMNVEKTKGNMVAVLFDKLVSERIVQPTFIIDHPKETTPLCKIHRKNNELVERFEPIIAGMELGNAYSELNDPILQRALLEEQAKKLRAGFDEAHPMDEDFIRAIEYGMPPTGGLGIGIDRMVMLFTNQQSIRDVILFPFMRPI